RLKFAALNGSYPPGSLNIAARVADLSSVAPRRAVFRTARLLAASMPYEARPRIASTMNRSSTSTLTPSNLDDRRPDDGVGDASRRRRGDRGEASRRVGVLVGG